MDAAIIIGDIHGCADELDDMLRLHANKRNVYFAGDLVAKGPNSAGVIDLAIEYDAKSVMGNHDIRCARYFDARLNGRETPDIPAPHLAISERLNDAQHRYLHALPFYRELPEFNSLLVHAGFMPNVDLSKQSTKNMTTMRSISNDGEASKYIEGRPWASCWSGPKHVFFGHDAIRGRQDHAFATGLDSGCVYGKTLTAILLPERRFVQVEAKKVWCAID